MLKEDNTNLIFLLWAGHVARMEEGRSAFKILTGKSRGNILLRRLGIDGSTISESLKEIDINTRNWVDSVQDENYWRAVVNVALSLLVPLATDLVS